MNNLNQKVNFDLRKSYMLNFSRDSDRDHFVKKPDFFGRGLRTNGMSMSFSQKSDHRTTSPASILNPKFQANLKDLNPALSIKSILGKREVGQFAGAGLSAFKVPHDNIELPKFSFKDSFYERVDKNPNPEPFPNFKTLKKRPNLASLESIVKIDFQNKLHKQFLLKPRSTKKLQFQRQPLDQSINKDRTELQFFNSRENSLSYQDSKLPLISRLNFGDEPQFNGLLRPPKLNGNLLSSMRPNPFPRSSFNQRFSSLNFSNPNSKRLNTFKPVSRLNMSTNDRPKQLEVIQGSEAGSRLSHATGHSRREPEYRPEDFQKVVEIKPKQSKKSKKVEPSLRLKSGKLEELIEEFERDLENEINISEEEARLLKIILKFLFDFDIQDSDFAELTSTSQTTFRKFLMDRYFKDETERENQLKFLYHDVVVHVDEEKNEGVGLEDLVQTEIRGKVGRQSHVREQVKFIRVLIKKFRKGVVDSVYPGFLDDFRRSSDSAELECKTVQMSRSFLLTQSPKILLLQKYLRKREKLNLICRRRKKMHKKSKRNDEKVKKIFKRIMKSLLRKFRASHSAKSFDLLSSAQRESAFYKHYFEHLEGNISEYYDPLKRKLANPKFKSISTKYLTFLAKSELFVHDLKEYCTSEMVFEVLEKYPKQLLKRYKENPNFLLEMDKFKSKFEWIKHELQAAIFHFMSIFKICLKQASGHQSTL